MLSPSAHLAEYLIVILALAGVGAWHLLLEFVGASLAGLATGASLPFPRSAVGKEAVPSSVVFVTLLNFRGDFDGGKIDDFFFFFWGGTTSDLSLCAAASGSLDFVVGQAGRCQRYVGAKDTQR